MMKNRSLWQTTGNALNGLGVLLGETAARREVAVLALTGAMVLWRPDFHTLVLFALSWVLLAVEAMNTAVERLCDLYSLEYDDRIKKIKDVASAAIFLILAGQTGVLLSWAMH